MVKKGDLTQQRSLNDGHVIRIGLTEKGIRLRGRLTTMHQPGAIFFILPPKKGHRRSDPTPVSND
jgi:hypothetical protein